MNLKKNIKLAVERFKNPKLKRIKGNEVFVDERILSGDLLGFNCVIRIKDNSKFFNHGDGRLNGMIDLFTSDKGLWIQFVGIDHGIWLAILDVDRIDSYSDSYITIEEHQRKLDMACKAIDTYARQIDSNASVFARVCKKEDLLGKVVMEIWNIDKYDDSKLSQSDMEKIRRTKVD